MLTPARIVPFTCPSLELCSTRNGCLKVFGSLGSIIEFTCGGHIVQRYYAGSATGIVIDPMSFILDRNLFRALNQLIQKRKIMSKNYYLPLQRLFYESLRYHRLSLMIL